MKMAIVGTGLVGMQAALYFHDLDCEVILIGAEGENSLGGEIARMVAIFPEMKSELPDCQVLAQSCEEKGLLLHGHVTLIRKCTTMIDGPLIGSDRMKDLFRLHYRNNNFESFIDVDVVIDARGPGRPIGLSLDGAQALGESSIHSPKLIYGIPTQKQWLEVENIFQALTDPVRILIAGSGQTGQFLFLKWFEILKKTERNLTLTVLSSEEKFFGNIKQREQIETAINWGHETYQKRYEKYRQDLKNWEELEDYMQAKVARPLPPRFQIEFIGNAQVQAIDAPLDRKDFFITYETARWDNKKLQDDGPFTVGADFVFVANKRFREPDRTVILHPEEPGFYCLRKGPTLKNSLLNVELIKEDLSRFFHRA